jgi:hypothetical protein
VILDSAGKTVRTLRGTNTAGINRVTWDLRNETSAVPRMKTKPAYDAEFTMASDGTRAAVGFAGVSVLMPPGKYTVRLTVDGQSSSQPLTVLKDPNSVNVTDASIRAAAARLMTVQSELNNAAQVLTTIEDVRVKADSLLPQLTGTNADLRAATDSLEQKFMTLESRIVDLRLTGEGQDEVRWPVKLGGQLNYLAGGISVSDFAPTAQQRDVHAVLSKEAREVTAGLQALARDLTALNDRLRARGLKTINVAIPSIVF